jgi:hypothetical protein
LLKGLSNVAQHIVLKVSNFIRVKANKKLKRRYFGDIVLKGRQDALLANLA